MEIRKVNQKRTISGFKAAACKLTIGTRLEHEVNYCKFIALEEKELVDCTTQVEITCKYLDNTKTVKGLQTRLQHQEKGILLGRKRSESFIKYC